MPAAWRIIKAANAGNAFGGEGARLYGSRWSTPGHRVAFASTTLSLATLEVLVHLQASALLASYVTFSVGFSEDWVEPLDPDLLPLDWRRFPAPVELQAIGDRWVKGSSSLLLRVPSAVIPQEFNFLINPDHEDFAKLKIEGPMPFDLDGRLFRSA